jgi:curved DNA-binding protein CbpA
MPRREPTHYEMLGVLPGANLQAIERAYRRLARRYHPDRNPTPAATARMARINAAYQVLRDPALRAEYDRLRRDRALDEQIARLREEVGTGQTDRSDAGDSWWDEADAGDRGARRVLGVVVALLLVAVAGLSWRLWAALEGGGGMTSLGVPLALLLVATAAAAGSVVALRRRGRRQGAEPLGPDALRQGD